MAAHIDALNQHNHRARAGSPHRPAPEIAGEGGVVARAAPPQGLFLRDLSVTRGAATRTPRAKASPLPDSLSRAGVAVVEIVREVEE